MTLLICGGLRLPAKALHYGTVALRLRVARRAVRRIYLHVRRGIRGRPVILALHVGLAGDVRCRRQRRLTTGRRVRTVHAVAVDLTRIAVRYQGPLQLRREAAHLNSACVISSFVRYRYRHHIS